MAQGFLFGRLVVPAFLAVLFLSGGQAKAITAALTGQYQTTSSGTAAFSLDIDLPPGIGVRPSLRLTYNSNGGDGIAGLGWNLSGVEAITRCPATRHQDGFFDPVDFDENDRFCLNGQRLVAIKGAYGQDGTEYRTEIDSYARIISYGNTYGGGRRTGPRYFKVWLKSGEIKIYGNAGRALTRLRNGSVVTWNLWRVLDRYGNYAQYNYYNSAVDAPGQTWREQYLRNVEYSGNTRTGEAPFVKVEFIYATRKRPLSRYSHGTEFRTKRLLKSIKVSGAGRFLRQYFIKHDPKFPNATEPRYRVTRIEMCVEPGHGNCVRPVKFATNPAPAATAKAPVLWATRTRSMGFDQSHWPMDVDGNGLTDMVYNVKGTPDYNVILNLGAGRTREIHWATRKKDVGYDPQHWVADINGDGRSDLVYNEAGTDKYHVLLSRGADKLALDVVWRRRGTGSGGDRHWVIDINGDGRSDLVFRHGRKYYAMMTYAGGCGSKIAFDATCPRHKARFLGEAAYDLGINKNNYPIDVNGDGLTDIVYGRKGHAEYRVLLTRLDASGNPYFEEMKWGVRKHDVGYNKRHWVLDANGDGLSDLLYKEDKSDDHYYVLINTGNPFNGQGFIEKHYGQRTQDNLILNSRHIIMDVNADGRSDVLFVQPRYETATDPLYGFATQKLVAYDYYVMLSGPAGTRMGDTRLWATSPILTKKDVASHWQMDIDGDGVMELLVKHPRTREYYVLRDSHSGNDLSISPALNKLAEITDGLGARTRIHYLPFSRPEIYRNEKGTGYKVRHSPPVGMGVRKVSTTNGTNRPGEPAMNDMLYSYYSSRVDQIRHLPLGFGKIVEYNPQTGNRSTTIYYQKFPIAGMTSESWVEHRVSGSWRRIRRTTSWFPKGNTHRTVQGIEARYYQLLGNDSTSFEYEISDGSLIRKVYTSRRDLDDYGNVGKVVTVTTGPNGEKYTTITRSTYSNDPEKWILGRLTRSVVTSRNPRGNGSTRTSAFAYDDNTGVLIREIIEPEKAAFRLEKRYGYNRYGMQTLVRSLGKTGAYPIPEVVERTETDFSQLRSKGILKITTINAIGQRETKTVDALLGGVLVHEGPNGIKTFAKYDRLGREVDSWTRVHPKYDLHTRTYYQFCQYVQGCPANAVYRVVTKSDGSAPVIAYYDVLGRKFMTESRGLNGEIIRKHTEYDRLGRSWRVSQPYYAGDGPQYWTVFTYDDLGRVIREDRPDGGYTRKAYYKLSVTSWQGGPGIAEQKRVIENDVMGRLVRVVDAKGNVTRYDYDARGNLIAVTDSAGNVTRASYNFMGWRTRVEDPDMGVVETRYDALGRARWEKDAKGNIAKTFYDKLGRTTHVDEYDVRTGKWTRTWWKYDDDGSHTAGASIGKLYQVESPGYRKTIEYDAFGRVSRQTIELGGLTHARTLVYQYDRYGRKHKIRYPSGLWIQKQFNAHGHLYQVRIPGGKIFWKATAADVFGNVVQEEFGNGLVSNRIYDNMGRVQRIFTSSNNLGAEVQDLSYAFDALGNLTRREDHRQGLTEKFTYDTLNRLISAELVGVGKRTYAYDALGNLLRKENVADYRYGENGAGPHAVTYAGGKRYYYDRNGNMISGGGREILWSAFDKPVEIRKGNTRIRFFYGPDKARFKQVKTVDGKTTVTWYIGKLYEFVAEGSKKTHKDYIAIGHATLIREKTGAKVEYKYLFKDHQGSTDVVTDATGKVLERDSFAPFGERRLANWRDPGGRFLTSSQTTRGYTGHEQLDEVGLIHMNGRVYDPELGRFLSPDPNVQAPLNSQNLNRYSYVLNNPLSYTDPSGFFFDKLGDLIQDLASNPIVRSVAMVACNSASPGLGQAACAGAMTAAFTKAAGGSWDDALQAGAFAAVSSATAYGVGHKLGIKNPIALAGMHGVTQGALAAAQGGDFVANFAAAAFSKVAGSKVMELDNLVAETIVMAVIGGTTSEITGGKFANGAISSSFVYLYNQYGLIQASKEISYEYTGKTGPHDNLDRYEIKYKGKSVGIANVDPAQGNVFDKITKAFKTRWFAHAAKAFYRGKVQFLVEILNVKGTSSDFALTTEDVITLKGATNLDKIVPSKLHTKFTWDTVFMHEIGHIYYDHIIKPTLPDLPEMEFYSDRKYWDEYFSVWFENEYRQELYNGSIYGFRPGYRKDDDFYYYAKMTQERMLKDNVKR